jgi:hypothetical protein
MTPGQLDDGSRDQPARDSDTDARRPTVSVIVPCYNYAHFLDGCVASVLSQPGVDVRVLIVDDHSPDNTRAEGERLAKHDSRVEYRRHDTNVGLIGTANEGLQWASGDYVVLLSADDVLVPGSLRRATTVMTKRANVGLVYGRPLFARPDRPMPAPRGRWRTTHVWPGEDWIRLRCRAGHNCMSSPEVVVRNSVQQAVGGYDPSCFHTSDLNMWLRIAATTDVAHIRGVPQAVYRVHADSMLHTLDGPLSYLRERQAAFDSFFAVCASQLARPDELQAIASRTFARQALWLASRAVDRGGDDELIEQYVELALDAYPDSRQLLEWRGLALRRRIGGGRSLIFIPFIATGAMHRMRYHTGKARLRFRGT